MCNLMHYCQSGMLLNQFWSTSYILDKYITSGICNVLISIDIYDIYDEIYGYGRHVGCWETEK